MGRGGQRRCRPRAPLPGSAQWHWVPQGGRHREKLGVKVGHCPPWGGEGPELGRSYVTGSRPFGRAPTAPARATLGSGRPPSPELRKEAGKPFPGVLRVETTLKLPPLLGPYAQLSPPTPLRHRWRANQACVLAWKRGPAVKLGLPDAHSARELPSARPARVLSWRVRQAGAPSPAGPASPAAAGRVVSRREGHSWDLCLSAGGVLPSPSPSCWWLRMSGRAHSRRLLQMDPGSQTRVQTVRDAVSASFGPPPTPLFTAFYTEPLEISMWL